MITFVVATSNRPTQLMNCVSSVLAQRGCFEVIVIDQSDQSLFSAKDLPGVTVIHTEHKGLSAARNRGVQESKGEIIAFIDDDATVHPKYAEILESFLSQNPNIAGLAGRVLVDSTGEPYAKTQKGTARMLDRRDWMTMLGGNIAFRRATLETIGPFDERLGAGVRWASGEESDYFFRMIECHKAVIYLPQLIVYHPTETLGHTSDTLSRKLYGYGRGHGALFAKHLRRGNLIMLWYWLWSLCKQIVRVVQFALTLKTPMMNVHSAILKGRIAGFFEYVD